MVRIFISYAHTDEDLRQELGKHLAGLKRQGLVETWHDRDISAGEEWARSIDENLRAADVILLLVSVDFIASQYCSEIELTEALRRHDAGEAVVIPVILRPCAWENLPLGKLQSATRNGKPIVKFPTWDDGFLEVVRSIQEAAGKMEARRGKSRGDQNVPKLSRSFSQRSVARASPRSANLHVRRSFTDHDRDQIRLEAFDYIANFFENSLKALEQRNGQLKTQYRGRDTNGFEAAAYESGKLRTRCGIWIAMGHSFGGDIAYSNGGLGSGNSYNEAMSVTDDGYILGLKAFGMTHFGDRQDQILTLEGAAEYFWQIFVAPLQ